MDRIRAGDFRSGDDAVDLQVRFLAGCWADADRFVSELDVHRVHVRLGINGDGFDIKFAAGADDAEGNFTAIGDEDALEHGVVSEEVNPCALTREANLFDAEKDVAVLDGCAIFGDDGADGTGFFRFDFIHHLHGLDDAESLADGDA